MKRLKLKIEVFIDNNYSLIINLLWGMLIFILIVIGIFITNKPITGEKLSEITIKNNTYVIFKKEIYDEIEVYRRYKIFFYEYEGSYPINKSRKEILDILHKKSSNINKFKNK